jgi:hypothetical protein
MKFSRHVFYVAYSVSKSSFTHSPLSLMQIKTDDYHIPEDDNHHSHRRGNLKSYQIKTIHNFSLI